MKIAQRLTLTLAVVMTLGALLRAYVDVRRAEAHFLTTIRATHRELGITLGTAVTRIP